MTTRNRLIPPSGGVRAAVCCFHFRCFVKELVPFETKRIEYTRNGVTRKYPYCDYELYPKGDWNYAFYNADFSVNRSEIGEYPFSVTAPPVTVTANMQKINWGTRIKLKTVCRKAPNSLTPLSDKEEVRLFPYGCAKLRMTEMPLLNK